MININLPEKFKINAREGTLFGMVIAVFGFFIWQLWIWNKDLEANVYGMEEKIDRLIDINYEMQKDIAVTKEKTMWIEEFLIKTLDY